MHRTPPKEVKIESPLHYIFQAAMGQCSTLPADGNRNQAAEGGGKQQMTPSMSQSKQRSYNGSNASSNSKKQVRETRETQYYGRPGDDDAHRHNDGDVVMSDGGAKLQNVNEGSVQSQSKTKHAMPPPQYASGPPKSGRRSKVHACPTADENIPLPPEGAVRTRCYRLNLDAPVVLSPTHDHLGPFPYDPPAHHLPSRGYGLNHVSASGDSAESAVKSTTQIAINTARIFRGITTDKNGVILSQNARASRSKNGKDRSKQADKSRQGNKIEKAMDIVDEDGGGSGKENDAEKSNMASLIVVGEYDDMKQLVRDGAKKLRDNDSHPDENLFALNRSRHALLHKTGVSNDQLSSPMSAQSRKRLPSPLATHHTIETPTRSRSRNRVTQVPVSNTPPKLKGHPRDRPNSSRRQSSSGAVGSGNEEKSRCNDISLFGGGDSDWSEALDFSKGFNSIWNCGGTGNNAGAASPTNSTSPKTAGSTKGSSSKGRYEGRNETSARFSRGGGVPTERDAPGVIL